MRCFLILTLLTFSTLTYGQSPTFRSLLDLNHNVDNNIYPLSESDTEQENLYWANIFFNYYKNPNTRGTQGPDKNMFFSISYEYLIQKKISSDSAISLFFPIGTTKDRGKINQTGID